MASVAAALADELANGWTSTARKNQLPPDGDWTVWLLLAGRGFGKSRAGAEYIRGMVETGKAGRVALVGSTASDVRDVMIEGPSGLLSIAPNWNRPEYEPSKRRITWSNGAVASAYSSEEADRLRGPQFDLAWGEEMAAWNDQENTWDTLMLALRLGARPRVCVSTTPRPSKLMKELVSRVGKDVVISRGSTIENRANLAPAFLDQIVRRYAGTRLGRQELEAELLVDVEGALWSLDMIEAARIPVGSAPNFKRVVVAVDPAISVSETSDETGIVVAGLGEDGRGYIIEDASGKYMPHEWARRAIGLYRKHVADRIVAEINQGGQMVEQTIRSIDASVSFKGVHAKRGKLLRAEPVSALFEQGRVKIAGSFAALEDQMASFAGGGDSPDRLDAMVYAISSLMVEPERDRPEAMTGTYTFCGPPRGVELRAQMPAPQDWIKAEQKELTH